MESTPALTKDSVAFNTRRMDEVLLNQVNEGGLGEILEAVGLTKVHFEWALRGLISTVDMPFNSENPMQLIDVGRQGNDQVLLFSYKFPPQLLGDNLGLSTNPEPMKAFDSMRALANEEDFIEGIRVVKQVMKIEDPSVEMDGFPNGQGEWYVQLGVNTQQRLNIEQLAYVAKLSDALNNLAKKV